MQAVNQQTRRRVVYIQRSTKNKSFLDMHRYLKNIGIKNNAFMLALLDPDLDGINPHDANLNAFYKQKILRECICNYWYYLREVVRIPDQGGTAVPFKLTRANMAVNFCMALNLNVFEEIPRQQGKTVSAAARYLYVFNFGTTNSKIGFFHKNMEGAKDNLQTLKDIRDLLPEYLIMKEGRTIDGKILKGSNTVESMKNPINNNLLKAFPSATNKAKAASLARGKSLTGMWFDEYGFLQYNDIIYMNAMPAFKTAADNARRNGSPYGILITTTPGFMTEDCGREAYNMKESATRFDEQWYDFTYKELMELLDSNVNSDFVYIKFSYQQLGCTEQWFKEVCKNLKNSWTDIRREILLEWATGVENSPFKEEDLDAISRMIVNPISTVYIFGKYRFDTYLQTDTITYPPIMGVDVSGGLKKDSSTITIIDSRTTKVLGCMNCNYISTNDLARVIHFITTNWMNNVVINVERNGGFGLTVISRLIKMGIKKNLYYEIKDVVVEEKQDGVHAYKQKVRKKVYGTNSDHRVRQLLIDILLDRAESHKDKFISPIIYEEMLGMEIKRNGKVEHSNSTHDDQVFSMLLALYVWYEGINLMERFGIKKTSIRTDEDIDDEIFDDQNGTVEIIDKLTVTDEQLNSEIEQTINDLLRARGTTINEFIEQRRAKEQAMFKALMYTPAGERAYRQQYNIPDDVDINAYGGSGFLNDIPESTYDNFYDNNYSPVIDNGNINQSNVFSMAENNPGSFDDGEYRYEDHFNF